MIRAVVVVAILSCGGNAPVPAARPEVRECDAATAGIGRRETLDAAHRRAIAARCRDDNWTAAARSCLAKAMTKEAADRCANTLLTVGQLEEIDRVMGRAPVEVARPPTPSLDPAIQIGELSPARGDAEGGTYVVIAGSGFSDTPRDITVFFGGAEAEVIRTLDESIIVRSPAGKAGETVDVKLVFVPGGTSVQKRAFTYNPPRKTGWDDED